MEVGVVGYRKTEGFATIHGQMFEVKLAALLFLRATTRALDFQLAVNVDGAGALDDIVFRYKASGVVQPWYTGFIQLKHKEGANLKVEMFTAPGGNFSLKKYLPSYLKIKSAMSAANKQGIFDGSIEDCHLAIYTNAKPDSKLQNRSFVCDSANPGGFESLLKSGLETEMIFGFDAQHDVDVASSLADVDGATDDDVAEFLSKLKVYCGQPSESELDALLGAEVASVMRHSELMAGRHVLREDIVDVVDKLVQEFHAWWSVKKNAHVLDQRSNIVNQVLVQFLSTEAKKSHRLNIKFDTSSVDSYDARLPESVSLLSVITDKASFKLSCTKTLQAFHKEEHIGKTKSCIFLTLERFLADEAAVTSVWTREECDCLCLVLATSESPPPGFLERLCGALTGHPAKKCVLLSVQRDASASAFCATKLGDGFSEFTDIMCFSQLDEDCRNAFLDRKLESQGHNTLMRHLMDGIDLSSMLINDEMVDAVLSGDTISIGQDLTALMADFSFYIPRTLQRSDVIVPAFLASQTSGCILLTGASVENVAALVPRPDEPNPDELRDLAAGCTFKTSPSKPCQDELNDFCTKDRIAHWFHLNPNGNLQWIWSLRGVPQEDDVNAVMPVGILFRKHLEAGEYSTVSVDLAGRVVLVVAEPGMGKTTLLNHLAMQAKDDNPDRLVVRVNLSDHTKLLADIASSNAVDFLMVAAGVNDNSSLEQSLFRRCLESSGKAVVLLDGFDEIAPSYCEEGCALIAGLLKTKVDKVWVTSRHSMREKLESHMSTIAFHLLPFSLTDQIAFVKTFWKKSPSGAHGFSDAALDARIEEFVGAVKISMNDDERQFMGVPLQTMMVAEIFKDCALNLANDTSVLVQDHLNLLDLFEKFVGKKLTVYANKVFASNLANNEGAMEDIREMFLKNHMHASLLLLLTDDDFSTLKAKDKIVKKATKFLKKVQDGKDKTGIIHSVTNGQPHFVHRTFAEYFTALWLSQHFDDARDLIDARLYDANFQVVRTLFDRLLAKGCALHNVVLSNNRRDLEALIIAGSDFNALDKGGRTVLHLAAAIGFNPDMEGLVTTDINIIKDKHRIHAGPRQRHLIECILAVNGVNVGIADAVLGLSPLQLAFRTESWDAVEILLQVDKDGGAIMRTAVDVLLSSVNVSHSVLILNEKITKLFIMTIVVSAYGFINFITTLLNLGVPVDFLIPYDNTTMLTMAAAFGEKKLVELLINRGANFTKYISSANTFPLHMACHRGHTAVVKALVGAVADSVQRLEFINSTDFWGHAALYHVAECGRTDILRFLIGQGVDIYSRRQTRDLETALQTACSFYGQLPVAKILIESFGDDKDAKLEYVNNVRSNGRSALYAAATYGHSEIVDFLISHGSAVDSMDIGFSDTALHKACQKGFLTVVQSLVRSFGNNSQGKLSYINSFNRMRKSPIYIAAEKDFFPVVEFLVNEGGGLYHAGSEHDSALIIAAKEGRTSVVNVLMKLFEQDEVTRKEYIDSRNVQGYTSVSIAAYHKQLHIADFLIRKGGDPRAKDTGINQAALHAACKEGDLPAVKAVVERLENDNGAMLETINSIMPRLLWSSLAIAIQYGFPDIAEFLIGKGCDIQPTLHVSYLHYACHKGQISVVEALLERFGEDREAKQHYVQQVDRFGESILDEAIEHEDLIAYLFGEGALLRSTDLRSKRSPLHKACINGRLLAAKKLLDCLGDDTDALLEYINHASVDGHTAVYDAACRGHADIVDFLISKGADVTKNNPGSKKTALHEACSEGHLGVVEVIVNSFAENTEAKMSFVNFLDFRGECALYAAAAKGKADVVGFLARQYEDLSDAPVNASTHHSALHEACDEEHEEVVIAILDSFSEDRHSRKREYINRLNARGFSPVYIAAYKANESIADLLVRHGGDVATRQRGDRDIAFYDACSQGYTAKVKAIIDSFVDDEDGKLQLLNSYNIYDCSDLPTPLHLAAWSGHADIAALLITEGCSLKHRRSGDRLYSFHRACEKAHLAVVRTIIDSFGDDLKSKSDLINGCDEYGRSALLIAAYEGNAHLTEYLIGQGGDASVCGKARKQVALHEAASVGSLPKVRQTLDSMADDPVLKLDVINSFDPNGKSALMQAANKGYDEVVKLLVKEGCDLIGRVYREEATVMHEAIYGSKVDVLNAILEGFGDDYVARTNLINRLNKDGQSEMYYAYHHGSSRVVSLFRTLGGDVNLN